MDIWLKLFAKLPDIIPNDTCIAQITVTIISNKTIQEQIGKMATATNARLTRTAQPTDGSLSFSIAHSEEQFNQVADHLVKNACLIDKQVEYARRVQSKLEQSRPLLQVIKKLKYITDDEIGQALRKHPISIRIGELLVELGHISVSELKSALGIQAEEKSKRKLGEILIERQFIQERVLVEVLSLQLGVPFVRPEWETIDRKLFTRVPLKWYESHHLLPIGAKGGAITVAFEDPLDQEELQAARQVFGDQLVAAIACKSAIQEVVMKAQRAEMKKQISTLDERFIVKLVDDIILAAIQREASDIHLEPLKDHLRVRFRQDGVLTHFDDFPPATAPAVASRIKVICEVDITEKRRHQGGRFFFDHPDGQLDVRASFYVTVHGEKVVLRLLNRHGQLRKIDDLGLSGRILKRFVEEALDLPSGVLLFTGPTGSGKTTTVYSCLHHITNPQMSIVTAEEPVEYVDRGLYDFLNGGQCDVPAPVAKGLPVLCAGLQTHFTGVAAFGIFVQ